MAAELSPDNRDVPQEVVPETFQGKPLYEVRLEVKGQGFADFPGSSMSFRLHPGGDVSEGRMVNGDESVDIVAATWSGQSAGDGTETIGVLSITGRSEDGRELDLEMSSISVSKKVVEGQQTTYTATIQSGQCALGEALWFSFSPGAVECSLTYYVIDYSAP